MQVYILLSFRGQNDVVVHRRDHRAHIIDVKVVSEKCVRLSSLFESGTLSACRATACSCSVGVLISAWCAMCRQVVAWQTGTAARIGHSTSHHASARCKSTLQLNFESAIHSYRWPYLPSPLFVKVMVRSILTNAGWLPDAERQKAGWAGHKKNDGGCDGLHIMSGGLGRRVGYTMWVFKQGRIMM